MRKENGFEESKTGLGKFIGKSKAKKALRFRQITPEPLIIDSLQGCTNLYNALNAFDFIDQDFGRPEIIRIANKKTNAVPVSVCAVSDRINPKSLSDIFNRSLNKLCFTQGQIKYFADKHRDWLLADGAGLRFLFHANTYYIAHVMVIDKKQLGVSLQYLDSEYLGIPGKHTRVAIPFLAN